MSRLTCVSQGLPSCTILMTYTFILWPPLVLYNFTLIILSADEDFKPQVPFVNSRIRQAGNVIRVDPETGWLCTKLDADVPIHQCIGSACFYCFLWQTKCQDIKGVQVVIVCIMCTVSLNNYI